MYLTSWASGLGPTPPAATSTTLDAGAAGGVKRSAVSSAMDEMLTLPRSEIYPHNAMSSLDRRGDGELEIPMHDPGRPDQPAEHRGITEVAVEDRPQLS